MKYLDIIIPVLNEAESIKELVERVDRAFLSAKKSYRIFFVDDNSDDDTAKIVKSLSKKYPIRYHLKKGSKGKAFSVLEAVNLGKSEYVAIIDGDLQYPPEMLPEMFKLASSHGVVVANRRKHETSKLRKFASKLNRTLFGKILLGFDCDTQSGLKVFRRDIAKRLNLSEVSPWTLDMPLLHTALDLGYSISCVDIDFAERKNGQSKIKFVRASAEIALGALKLKMRGRRVYKIEAKEKNSALHSGFLYKTKDFTTHTNLPHEKSALKTLSQGQKAFFGGLAILFLLGLLISVKYTLLAFVALLTLIYFLDVLFSLYVLLKSLHFPPELSFSEKQLSSLDESKLPVYTVLCPLYKEAVVLPEFMKSISEMDWPKEKLDVILLLEEGDDETINAAKEANLPSFVRALIVPASSPKTKPKACNYGLAFARGEYVVVYDAEDQPDPMQLKKAYLGFKKVGPKTFCLQSKLNYFNSSHNLLTRLFTAEYSLWFDLILPGLQSIDATIPLGGTSNHFRTKDLKGMHAWDPFNVTEDCDLGVRLFKAGYKTAIIDSTTLEEANSNLKNWVRQRSRWIKGYFQTYFVHTRDPIAFFRSHGIHALVFQLVIGMRMTFMLINPILWITTISYFAARSVIGPTIEALFPPLVFYMAGFALVFGNFMYLYNYMIGCAKRGHFGLIKFVFLIPFYWLFMSVAAFVALRQLISNPHYWEKTNHGLHLATSKKEKVRLIRSLSVFERLKVGPQIASKKYFGGLVLISATIIANFLNFLFNAYLGRSLSLEEFGLVTLITNFFFISNILTDSLAKTVSHRSAYLLGRFGKPAKALWKNTRGKVLKYSLLATIVWLLSIHWLPRIFNSDTIFPFLIFTPIWTTEMLKAVDFGFLSGSLKFGFNGLIIFLESVSKFLLAVLFVEMGKGELVYMAIPLSAAISLLFYWIFSRSIKGRMSIPRSDLRLPKRFFATSFATKLSTIAFLSFDIILAKIFLSSYEAGLYSLLSLIGKMVFFGGSLLFNFIVPLVSRDEGASESSKKLFYKMIGLTALTSFGAFVFLGPLGVYIAPILFGDKVLTLVPYFTYYAFGTAAFTVASSISLYHLSRKHYIFSTLGIFLTLLEIVVLSIFHANVYEISLGVSVLSVLYLVLAIVFHAYYKQIEIVYRNLLDLLGIFVIRINGKKKRNKDSLRILVFNWRDTKHVWAGGAEAYVHHITKRWVKLGHEVTLFCGNDGKSARNETIDGVKIVRRGGFYTVYLWAFLYYILRFRGHFDAIVESENGVPFFTPLYSRKPKILLVHHVHQEVFRENLSLPLSLIARFVESKLMPFVYRNQRVVAVSKSTKKDVLKFGFSRSSDVDVVNPGLSCSNFTDLEKTSYPSFIYMGRHKHYKNIDIAIRAFKKVLVKYPNARLIIAGDGDNTDSLKNLAVKLGVRKKISFLGRVSELRKVELLAKNWASIQPSSFEGWGITVLEANACRTPVIASRVNGLKDSVVHDKTGILVPLKNVNAFAEAILFLIENPKERKQMSLDAYKWSKKFSWNKTGERFFKIIKNEIEKKEHSIPILSLAKEEAL